MDNANKQLLEVVEEQKKTIEKYANKLRDIVAVHKSVLNEKKALENTIKILSEGKSSSTESNEELTENVPANTSEADLKSQLSSLLASFSSLVAEKSHMEECFRLNQKQLIDEKRAVELQCEELQSQVKSLTKLSQSVEDKTNSEYVQGKFQKTLKHNKTLSHDSKDKPKAHETFKSQVKNYEKEISNLKYELQAKKLIHEISEKKLNESSLELNRLHDEIRTLQLEHEMAILKEKEKVKSAEENAKKLTAVQEERVFNLETRLAELSETIGSYDRLRLQDQIEIQKLKEHIAHLDFSPKESNMKFEKPFENAADYDTLKENFLHLKKQLELLSQKFGREDDFKALLKDNYPNDDIHSMCKEEYNKLKAEFEYLKNETKVINAQVKSTKDISSLQNQVKSLQDKVKILSEKNKDLEKEYLVQIEQLKKTLSNEKTRYKEVISAAEADHKARVWLLEEQLQKQRERSLALLEEKEQEVNALQNTFQMFLPGYKMNASDNKAELSHSDLTKTKLMDGPHIVHYANELARRDVEISNLRRNKHQIEVTLRDLQKDVVADAEKHKEEKQMLLKELARLERCQTREGANLEYLKNVVYNFLLSNDPNSKRHMCNAIAAVLKFSEAELEEVVNHSKNSWWTRSNVL